MIKNNHQYEITKQWVIKFTEAIEDLEEQNDLSVSMKDLLKRGLQSQLDDLLVEIREYENSGSVC